MADKPTHVLLPAEPTDTDLRRMERVARAMTVGGKGDARTLRDYVSAIYYELIRPYT